MTTLALEEPFFRHEYGRLVAMLSRRAGMQNLDVVEDAVQSALLAALTSWPRGGVPDHPSAWLFRAAYNCVVGELRRRGRVDRLTARYGSDASDAVGDPPAAALDGDVRDDILRMLFACCDESMPVESQLAIALTTLCGFGVHEVAERLFISEANVYKRLGRARSRLRTLPFEPDELSPQQLAARLPAVRSVLYVLFTEGYLSSHVDGPIRRELCEEATRLAHVLAEHPVSATAETFALVALMHLHGARMAARQDGSGGLLLLEEQDRARWDHDEIQRGLSWLARSADGDVFSRYHAEAGIAAEHCLAASFAETRWDRIIECYELLERLSPSPIHTLNRAVAVAEQHGPARGLSILDGLEPPSWFAGSYLWAAVLADLHRRCGHSEAARGYRDAAIDAAPSPAVKDALQRRLRDP
ncbi:MAG TPA: sigma-70 family RNA polymerase sigma factor [Kofleriaceae bacterium]|nr:sigma-70 family RNA polymerase sigma factor [Kofleriaceae bacterium]